MLRKNLTCLATISENKAEFLKFIEGSGSRNEIFEDYFSELLKAMKEKYPDKQLLFVLDNLKAHKCSLIWKIMQDDQA